MTDRQLHRRLHHENNSKKCRLTLGSSGTFLFDKKQRKEQNYNKFYHILPYITAFKIFA
jgi:hypothetical protein